MIISLTLKNFRRYAHQKINFSKTVNLLIGDNAQGKTSLLEAVYYLHSLRSALEKKQNGLIRINQRYAELEGTIYSESRRKNININIHLENGKKKVMLNDIPLKKASEVADYCSAVFMAPVDQQIISGEPQERRNFLDNLLWKQDFAYSLLWSNYADTLRNRNHLLKTENQDQLLLAINNSQLANYGALIIQKRKQLISNLNQSLTEIFSRFFSYQVRITYLPGSSSDKNIFCTQLQEKLSYDQQMKFTSIGPHRDDFNLEIDNKDARSYASNGQRRLLAIALRWCEAQLIKTATKQAPVILADDILAELDQENSHLMLNIINSSNQVLLTATGQHDYLSRIDQKTTVYQIQAGTIQKI